MKHPPVIRGITIAAFLASLASMLVPAGRAAADEGVAPEALAPGSWSVQFSVQPNFTLGSYSGSTLSLNHHHPLNDIVGVNIRAFELAGCGACQIVDWKEELPPLFTPGEELVVYRDPHELRRQIDYYLAHPDEAKAIGENGLRRALKEHTARHRLEEIFHVVETRFGRRW